jgi:hypothetical protein
VIAWSATPGGVAGHDLRTVVNPVLRHWWAPSATLLEVLDGLRILGLEGVATHPSDLAVALIALDALVITRDSNGEHPIRISEFFRQPGSTPNHEHNLRPGQLIVAARSAGAARVAAIWLPENCVGIV